MVFLDQPPCGRGLSRGRSLLFPHPELNEASQSYAVGEALADGLARHSFSRCIARLLYARNAMGWSFVAVELAHHHWTPRGISRSGDMLRH